MAGAGDDHVPVSPPAPLPAVGRVGVVGETIVSLCSKPVHAPTASVSVNRQQVQVERLLFIGRGRSRASGRKRSATITQSLRRAPVALSLREVLQPDWMQQPGQIILQALK